MAESDNSIGETINIGLGKTYSIKELVNIIGTNLGTDLESRVETEKSRIRPEKSEVKVLLCDNSKAKRIIGWEPKISLEEGIPKVIDYIKNNLDKYHLSFGLK